MIQQPTDFAGHMIECFVENMLISFVDLDMIANHREMEISLVSYTHVPYRTLYPIIVYSIL